jgi:HK97 family phage portal protein
MKLVPNFIRKMFHTGWAAEGQWRPTAGIGEFGNVFPIPFGDGFQRGLGGARGDNATIYALVQCYVMALGGAGIDVKQKTGKGGWKTLDSGNAFRVMRYPNPMQTQIEFITYLVTSLFYTGNFYAQVQRNDRYEIIALWPLQGKEKRAVLSPDGAVYYDASSDYQFLNKGNLDVLVPARDMLHVKLPSNRSLLNGDSLVSHAVDTAFLNSVLLANAAAFNANSSQGSGILSTDLTLSASQMDELRTKFAERTTGPNRGQVPVLGGGLKWYPMTVTPEDAQMVELYKMSVLDLCRLFRVPPQLFGQEANGAASSVETLINQWRASGLLYFCELIEEALEKVFDTDASTEFEFDLDNISRADSPTTMDVLSKGVQNGIFSPNEARERVGLDAVEYGDEPRVQAQNVRLQDAVPASSAPSAPVGPQGDPATDEDVTQTAAANKAALVDELLSRIGAQNG